jgi:hypothetical protein
VQFTDQPTYVNYVVDALWEHCAALKHWRVMLEMLVRASR